MRVLALALMLCSASPAWAQFTSPTVCWDFEEASGTRAPTTGSTNLSVTGSVPSAAGKSGNAADFSGSTSDYLSAADNAELSVTDQDFSWAAWVYFDSTAGGRPILQKDTSLSQYVLFYNNAAGADEVVFRSAFFDDAKIVGAAPGTGTWYLFAGYHDSVNDLNGVSFNGSAFTTAAATHATSDEANDFIVGFNGASEALDGRVDMLVFWKGYVLTGGNITTLNGGAGTCAGISGGGGGGGTAGGRNQRGVGK